MINFKQPPQTADGRTIVLPSVISDNLDVQYTGRGDDVTNGQRLVGAALKLTGLTDAGDHSLEWQFMEYVDILGGSAKYTGAEDGDALTYEVIAPASPATSNPGAGVFDKYAIGGGMSMFIPNATQEGDWDLDLGEKLNANVNITKVTPIPSEGDGFFDYDFSTGVVSVNYEQAGGYYLFDADYILSRFLNAIPMHGSQYEECIVPASYGGKRLLPHWKHKVTISKNATSGSLSCYWHLFLGRESSRPY